MLAGRELCPGSEGKGFEARARKIVEVIVCRCPYAARIVLVDIDDQAFEDSVSCATAMKLCAVVTKEAVLSGRP